jgi:hypothetical protein
VFPIVNIGKRTLKAMMIKKIERLIEKLEDAADDLTDWAEDSKQE